MEKEPLVRFMQQYVSASPETLAHMVAPFEERVFAKHDWLLKAGSVCNEYLFLSEGCLRAFTHDPDGNEVTTSFFTGPGVAFDASSFFMRTVSMENIQALTESRGFVATFDQINTLFHTIPEFREFGRSMLVREFALFKQRTLRLINQTAEERYTDLMNQKRAVFQHAQLKQIASYLGVTDSSLSRIRREFAHRH
ncbi:MAG: Crp/Fnr family transcriptional regulator [Cytophagales bacterium]|nr:MAG: Crp/Fnr family transcriptional regulator [Cytophagales bacterium]